MHFVKAESCSSAYVATMIGSTSKSNEAFSIVSAVHPETYDMAVAGSQSHEVKDNEILEMGFLYFLDYSECEIMWYIYFESITEFVDVTFAAGSTSIVALGYYANEDD